MRSPSMTSTSAAAIAAATFLAMFKLRWPMLRTLAISAATGAALHLTILT